MNFFRRRTAVAVAVVLLLLAIWWQPLVGLVLALALTIWWLCLRPSNTRNWLPEYAEPPWAEIDGDAVTIHNFRNSQYRAPGEVIPRWETRTFHLAQLRGVDLLVNDFGSRHIVHTFLSFDFGPEGYICTSIEARRQEGEIYTPLHGLFRQYELYYVMGDERDLIRLRTEHRRQGVYIYRLVETDPKKLGALFLVYLRAANELRERPRWYHAAVDNCTTNIRVNARASGLDFRWTWQILFNGHLDEFLFRQGMIPSPLSFADTKTRAYVNDRVRLAGDGPDFSIRIREQVPAESKVVV